MCFSFIPKRLQEVRKEVSVLHGSENKLLDVSQMCTDDELERLIRSLVAMDEAELAMEAFALSDFEVYRMVAYIPYNYFKVNMQNLFRIFLARSEEQLCKILYEQWQNSYANESCNNFLRILLENDDNFKKYMKKNHLETKRMEEMLRNQDIAFGFGTEVMKYSFESKMTLVQKFNFFGVHKDSKLYKDCADIFYTYCGKMDYLEADSAELLSIIKKYEVRNQPLLKAFLLNFLGRLQLVELAEFSDLARYFESIVGEVSKPKAGYRFLFEDMPVDIIEKYSDWINRCRIERYFGNDERSDFWKQYRFTNVQRFEKSNAVVMEFKEYVAVEFLGKAMGPIYFYPKEYFETALKGQFMLLENSPMRQYLLHESRYAKEDRKEHRGYWQYSVSEYIITHHVTRKVFA